MFIKPVLLRNQTYVYLGLQSTTRDAIQVQPDAESDRK